MSLLLMRNASLKRISMRPDWMSFKRWDIMLLIVSLSRCFFAVGARTKSSKWTSSHQNGADASGESAEIIACIILDWIVWNRFLLLRLSSVCHVVRKWGGLWFGGCGNW